MGQPIRAVIMRGGTSKAVFLREADLPSDPHERERLILSIFGSPDKRQIDGLGGADPLTRQARHHRACPGGQPPRGRHASDLHLWAGRARPSGDRLAQPLRKHLRGRRRIRGLRGARSASLADDAGPGLQHEPQPRAGRRGADRRWAPPRARRLRRAGRAGKRRTHPDRLRGHGRRGDRQPHAHRQSDRPARHPGLRRDRRLPGRHRQRACLRQGDGCRPGRDGDRGRDRPQHRPANAAGEDPRRGPPIAWA